MPDKMVLLEKEGHPISHSDAAAALAQLNKFFNEDTCACVFSVAMQKSFDIIMFFKNEMDFNPVSVVNPPEPDTTTTGAEEPLE